MYDLIFSFVLPRYLYHANNNMKLTKTLLDGTIQWQKDGLFGQDTTVRRLRHYNIQCSEICTLTNDKLHRNAR